jgi:hypothetical protein
MIKIFLFFLLAFAVLPLAVYAQVQGIPDVDLFGALDRIGGFVFMVGMGIFVAVVLIGAMLFVTGGGDANRIAKAKKTLLWGAIGLIIMLVSTGVTSVLRDLLGTG